MASQTARQGLRLTSLIRRLGLSPHDFAKQDTKMAVTAVKAQYFELAKERHPDRAPNERKEEAKEHFVQLNEIFEETVQLLEHGVRPAFGETEQVFWQQPGLHPGGPSPFESMQRQRVFQHKPKQEFDLKTRIKGNLIFWSGLFIFLSGFREFLVWSAGSTYAWSSPRDSNIFWVRRFQDGWTDGKEKEKQPVVMTPKVQQLAQKKDRDIDSFYQKRGISNIRRKTEPRGLGRSI